jgi:hypothetical protein
VRSSVESADEVRLGDPGGAELDFELHAPGPAPPAARSEQMTDPADSAGRRVNVTRRGIDDAAAAVIAARVRRMGTVEILHAGGNDISGEGATAMCLAGVNRYVFFLIKKFKNPPPFPFPTFSSPSSLSICIVLHSPGMAASRLHTLNLEWNVRIGHDGAAAIASVLPDTAIVTLNLTGAGIGDRGAAVIAAMLAHRCALRNLSLASNGIRDAGARALAGALADEDAELAVLDLHSNELTNVGAAAIAHALRTNRGLVSLNLEDNGIDEDGVALIADSLEGKEQSSLVVVDEADLA